jgi:uncharacterized membrane protein YsdA (DUF1294 family)
VPEAALLDPTRIGGSPGAFVGMLLLRHKTGKPAFLIPCVLMTLRVGVLFPVFVVLPSSC